AAVRSPVPDEPWRTVAATKAAHDISTTPERPLVAQPHRPLPAVVPRDGDGKCPRAVVDTTAPPQDRPAADSVATIDPPGESRAGDQPRRSAAQGVNKRAAARIATAPRQRAAGGEHRGAAADLAARRAALAYGTAWASAVSGEDVRRSSSASAD